MIYLQAWDGRFSSTVIVFVHVITGELPVKLGEYGKPQVGDADEENGTSMLVIILVVVVCVLVLVGAIVLVICRLKPRRDKKEEDKINLNNVTVIFYYIFT